MAMEIHAMKVQKKSSGFDLFEDFVAALDTNGLVIESGDVVVISSKYVSNAQGRILNLNNVQTYPDTEIIAKKHNLSNSLAEVILRESDQIFGGISGFAMASSDNILAPNAGIDKSNSKNGSVILYPSDSYGLAEKLRRKILLKFGVNAGILIIDSRLMPSRVGTVGVTLSCAGIEPVNDLRAKKDLDGSPLKVTIHATVDSLATAANYCMGEGNESRPYVLIKNSQAKLTGRNILSDEIAISHEQCVYVRSLKDSN